MFCGHKSVANGMLILGGRRPDYCMANLCARFEILESQILEGQRDEEAKCGNLEDEVTFCVFV